MVVCDFVCRLNKAIIRVKCGNNTASLGGSRCKLGFNAEIYLGFVLTSAAIMLIHIAKQKTVATLILLLAVSALVSKK